MRLYRVSPDRKLDTRRRDQLERALVSRGLINIVRMQKTARSSVVKPPIDELITCLNKSFIHSAFRVTAE